MIRRSAVAGRTILTTDGGMVKVSIPKVAGVLMAGGTSTRKMVGRGTVASGTVRSAYRGMIKDSIAEVCRIAVASRTGTRVMIGWGTVTSGAILPAYRGVVKHGIGKVRGVAVASGTGSGPVVGWGRMATGTILGANGGMVKHGIGEVFGIAVAGRAGTGKMVLWWGVAGGAILVAHQAVIEGNGRPLRNRMASGTICAKLAFVWVLVSVAAHAGRRSPFVGAARVAIAALEVVVASHQGKEIMLQRTLWKWNIQRIVQTGRNASSPIFICIFWSSQRIEIGVDSCNFGNGCVFWIAEGDLQCGQFVD